MTESIKICNQNFKTDLIPSMVAQKLMKYFFCVRGNNLNLFFGLPLWTELFRSTGCPDFF